MRRVPQKAFFCTARIFRTREGPLRYRILQTSGKRRALPAANATTARKEEPSAKSAARDAADPSGVGCGRSLSQDVPIYKKSTLHRCKVLFGAENGARTRDLNLGKVALYQLSYFRNGTTKV